MELLEQPVCILKALRERPSVVTVRAALSPSVVVGSVLMQRERDGQQLFHATLPLLRVLLMLRVLLILPVTKLRRGWQ